MTFDKNLKTLIRQRGITTAELAKAIDVSPKTISDWLGGNRSPRDLDAVKRCAEYFNSSVHFVLYGEEDGRGGFASILEKTEIHTGMYEITVKKVTKKK